LDFTRRPACSISMIRKKYFEKKFVEKSETHFFVQYDSSVNITCFDIKRREISWLHSERSHSAVICSLQNSLSWTNERNCWIQTALKSCLSCSSNPVRYSKNSKHVLKNWHTVYCIYDVRLDCVGFDSRLDHWIFHWPNPSCRTMALESTQPLRELSTRNLPGSKGRPIGA
jgi:hypothetical protein